MAEKRKYMRFNVLMNAILRTGDRLKKLKVNNFCKEGIGILATEIFNKGDEVEIELAIPGDNLPVLFKGEIVWTHDSISDGLYYKGGVKLKDMSNNDRCRMLEHIYQKWISPAVT